MRLISREVRVYPARRDCPHVTLYREENKRGKEKGVQGTGRHADFFTIKDTIIAEMPATMHNAPAIKGRSTAVRSGYINKISPKMMLMIPSTAFPASFSLNAENRWAKPIKHAKKPIKITKNERIKMVL